MKFTITRSKWLRGVRDSRLLSDSGKRCCIGFCAMQCGVPDNRMLNTKTLRSLHLDDLSKLMPGFVDAECGGWELTWVNYAYRDNDNASLSEAEREQKLSALAAANGHEFVFVD